jgi:hypothetical protein
LKENSAGSIQNCLPQVRHTVLRVAETLTTRFSLVVQTFLVLCLSLFLAFPNYESVNDASAANTWEPVFEKTRNPLFDLNEKYRSGSHAANLNFRLTVPVIARLLGLGIVGILIIHGIAGFFLIYLVGAISRKISKDDIAALFMMVLVGSIFAGVCSFVQLRGGFYDGIAILFLLAALFFKNPFLIGLFTFLTAWTDERGLIASQLVLLFHLIQNGTVKLTLKSLFRRVPAAIYLAWFLYLGMRYVLATQFGLHTATREMGHSQFLDQINMIPFGSWTALEGGWVLVGLAIVILIRRKLYTTMFLYFFGVMLVLIISLSVFDITRSMAYVLPALFIALLILVRHEELSFVRECLMLAAVISVFWPMYTAFGHKVVWWHYPLPLQIVRWFTNQ